MKVLLTHRYFFPDSSPYGIILSGMANDFVNLNHHVSVFSSVPSYGRGSSRAPSHQRLNNDIEVRRVWVLPEASRNSAVRIINLIIYCFSVFIYILRARPDVVTAGTFPPVLAAWCVSLAARLSASKFIYHIQDIHPELSVYSGGFLGRFVPRRILTMLDNQTLKRADAIVTLSKDMADTLRARELGKLPISVINNPALKSMYASESPPREFFKEEGMIRVIFAGNLGRFQNLSNLSEGVALCFERYPNLELVLMGDGKMLPKLKLRWNGNPQVKFIPYLPFDVAKPIIENADIGLVSLNSEIYRAAYPSKVSTYNALGLKIVAVVEKDSQIARDIIIAGGVVAENDSPKGISKAIESLIIQRRVTKMSKDSSVHNWKRVLDKMK